jgi:hypothetical protein
MDNIVLLIHTHSSYSYLWPVINDYISNINIRKVLAHNSKTLKILPNNFDEYIYYDDSINYSRRMKIILEQLNVDYVFLVYDVDIMIYFNIDVFNIYHNIQKKNNIDRVCCATFNGREILEENGYALCNLNKPLKSMSNHFIPADCSPVIWKRSSFITLLNLFPNESYGSLELSKPIINYCKTQIKCYGIQYTPLVNIKYVRCLTYNDKLGFLHITTKGKFTYPLTTYMDFQQHLDDIVKKYNIDIDEIGHTEALHIFKTFRPLKI